MAQRSDINVNKILSDLSEEISFEYDIETDTMAFSEKYKKVYGRKNKILHFMKVSNKTYGLSNSTIRRLEILHHVVDYGDVNHYIQMQWPDKQGMFEWVELVFRHIKGEDGKPKAIGIWRNIDRQKREQVKLADQLITDDMEGVQNKVSLEKLIGHEVNSLLEGDSAVLYLIDFDNIKQVESCYGVLALEELLHMFAKELVVHFHEDGIVGHIGSDKFVVYVRQVKDKEIARVLAKRIQKFLRSMTDGLRLGQDITITIGITLINRKMSYKEVMTEADMALQHGKNSGKNQFVFYSDNLQGEKYVKKLSFGKTDKSKKIYDAGKIWPDLLDRLYRNNNLGTKESLMDAFGFIGHLFHLDKIMVWEFDNEAKHVSNTIQWNREGITNTIEKQQKIRFRESEINFVHNQEGIFYCTSIEKMPDRMREYAEKEGFTALLQSRLKGEEDNCLGYIDFCVCGGARVWVQEEVDLLVLMAQVIGEIIRKRHMAEKMEAYYGNTRNILDNVVSGIFVLDQKTGELYYKNDALDDLLPYCANERKCKECEDCKVWGDKICRNHILEMALKETKNPNSLVNHGIVVHNDHLNKDFEIKVAKMLWENRINAYIVTINEHIASAEELERKRKQEYLEKRYAFIYSHSCDCIFDIDLDHNWYDATLINPEAVWPGFEDHGNYQDMFTRVLDQYVVQEDRNNVSSKFAIEPLKNAARKGVSMITTSYSVVSSRSAMETKELRAFFLEENGGQSVVITYCDITKQRRKENQILLERQKLNRAVVNVYPVMISINVTKDIVDVVAIETNNEYLNVDWSSISKVVLDIAMHVHPADRDRFLATFNKDNLIKEFIENNKNEISLELRQGKPDGSYIWSSVLCVRIDNPLNEDLLVYVFARNIDRQKKMEQNLRDALATAQQASEAKSDFLSRMSHEIRTPMNAIIGMTELATGVKDVPVVMSNYLAKIDVSAKYLLSLINNILDMSRIESNKVVIEKKEFYLDDMLENIQNIIGPQARDKGLQFYIEKKNNFDGIYNGDSLRLNQILINLLSNALKFTDEGGSITLSVKENRREGKESFLCFTVQDTGIGMSAEFMNNMYKPFEQEDATSARGMKGTGLGLSITKNLIALMDGHIKCKSKKGEGTTFIVELKMDIVEKHQDFWEDAPVEENYVDNSSLNHLVGKKILLAEDNELNQEIAIAMLEMLHVKVDCVENGELAIQKFLEMGSFHYDMILMDIRMPVKNGLEATSDIRAIRGKYAEEIPILAMSANAFAEDKAKAFANGMNDYIVKPIDSEVLKSMLVKYLVNEK